jgi:lactate permease
VAAAGALLPILVILALMLGARWAAGPAGLAGLAVALPVALFGFGFDARGLLGVFAEAGFSAFTILWIVFPALLLHEAQLATGGTATLRAALSRLSADPRIIALLIAWFFALFAEGAAGFGTPVALAAPLLVALGFPPVRAVALALVGHAVGVSFGAVGTPLMAQVAASGVDALSLSGTSALMHATLGWTMALMVHRIASQQGGTAGVIWPLGAAAAFLIPFTLIALYVGPELPTLGGALLGGAGFAWWLSQRGGTQAEDGPDGRAVFTASLPYLILLALILASRLFPPLRELLQGITIAWTLPGGFTGSMQPLYHPGTLLLLGLLAASAVRRTPLAELGEAVRLAGSRMGSVLFALVAMLALARLMVHAGLIDALAMGAANALGGAWPALSPAAGALGTFVTGSATASNILLTEFQRATAEAIGVPALLVIAGQGVGAALGNIICPHNIIAGAATVGLVGREASLVLRLTLPAALLYAALAGALLIALTVR